MAELTVGEDQNGREIVAHMGDTVILRLPETSGGGYRWTLTSIDTDRLDMKDERYAPDRAGIGSAGASVWRLTPKKTGRARVELKKVRPWDPADSARDSFAVVLKIINK